MRHPGADAEQAIGRLHGPTDPLATHCATPSKAESRDLWLVSLTIRKPGSPQHSFGKDTMMCYSKICDSLYTHTSRGCLMRAVERCPVPLGVALRTILAYPQLQ